MAREKSWEQLFTSNIRISDCYLHLVILLLLCSVIKQQIVIDCMLIFGYLFKNVIRLET